MEGPHSAAGGQVGGVSGGGRGAEAETGALKKQDGGAVLVEDRTNYGTGEATNTTSMQFSRDVNDVTAPEDASKPTPFTDNGAAKKTTAVDAPSTAQLPSLSLSTTLDYSHVPDQSPPAGLYTHLLDTALKWITTFPEWTLSKTVNAHDKLPAISLRKKSKEKDFWAGRSSTHSGSPGFKAFERFIKQDHSRYEGEYTPDVYAAIEIGRWEGVEVEGWSSVDVAIYEMYHHIPVLSDRLFTTLVLTAQRSASSFIVIQIPFNSSTLSPEASARSAHRNGKFAYNPTVAGSRTYQSENAKGKDGKAMVEGRYVSVEFVEVKEEKVEWTMTTSSDAGGRLPQWVTEKSLPGQIAKDVGFFLDWLEVAHKDGA